MKISKLNEVEAMHKLAWTRCSSHIGDVIGLSLGAVLGMFMLTIVIAYNFFTFIPQPVNGSMSLIIFRSIIPMMFFGTIQAGIGIAFLAVLICLFEYAYSFTRVAYYYDDCSWSIVNFPAELFDRFNEVANSFFKGEKLRQETINRNKRIELQEQIMLIKIEAEEKELKETSGEIIQL